MVYRVPRDVEGTKMRFLMNSLNVYEKLIVSILTMILLTFSFQGIGYSQNVPMEADSSYISTQEAIVRTLWKLTEPESYKEMYDETIPSLLWITTDDDRQASGVLIDKELRIAVTNEHVTENHESVNVFFPVRDKNGTLIDNRDFYEDERNRSFLTLLGYAAKGRVIAEEPENDLALLRLDGIPEIASQIDSDILHDYREMENGVVVHVLGNPGERFLWAWTAGTFQEVTRLQNYSGEYLHINADIFGGNSGGPLLNQGGRMIGIIAFSDRRMEAYAVPLEYIDKLKETLEEISVFSITNHTGYTVSYQIKWTEASKWKRYSLDPDRYLPHPYPSRAIPEDYPKIRFDHIAGDKEVSYKSYHLETNAIILGSGGKPNYYDTRKYHFKYDSQRKKFDLRDSEISVFSITNHTGRTVPYSIKWREDSEWKRYSLNPDHYRNHPYASTAISEKYPKIRFDHIVGDKEISFKSYYLDTNTMIIGSRGVSYNDTRKYQFQYNSQNKELDLYNLKD